MERQRVPDWVGGFAQPLALDEVRVVIDRVARRCMILAQLIVATAPERRLVHIEFSRWLGIAVGDLIAVAPHPTPELLRDLTSAVEPLESHLSSSPDTEIAALHEVFALLAGDRGWGNRNLAFVARQLHGDLDWWRAAANL
ncbi:MAG: hypothetical protein ACP5HZ_02940 [Ferrimicrobium sp.]|uniref:hypothetical protein n=1 Tax=Ferrimicrobium sp. TaxID=2926050 RepID=UPI002621FEC3|nr:hypothetical protein [Ferrimicrobium sp.]